MPSILDICTPREDLLKGSFNPEIFTAQLSQVINHYRGEVSSIHSIYADAEAFFSEATFPTEGLRLVLAEVFGRLAGDNSLPAIHRLETAFGGGKTHTLISCVHIANRGSELAAVTKGIIDTAVLPQPGEVVVVGVAGDEIPVHKPKGKSLVPYTLWGEIAFQVGGEALYKQVQAEATSQAAPGNTYFDAVFKGRKVLVMLDELAQYSARFEAAHPGGSEQLAAFLMALHGYARSHEGLAILLTLASQSDAFAGQTKRLQELITKVRGEDTDEDTALALAQKGDGGIRSVVARDATTVVPVQAAEISRVLAKRLFTTIDNDVAREVANEYAAVYQRSAGSLPDVATRDDYPERLAAHYPFHPTFIDFLNRKLSSVETFQGTRGVLRVLALAVRTLWSKKAAVPMIHTCHLDLRDARTIAEILGRTGGGDLQPVLNADVGSVDTGTIEGSESNAEVADKKNPHPDYPMHEWSWKTVFLHSLVGRDQGFASNLFGITEQDALLEVVMPGEHGLFASQVKTALDEIENSAYYLRNNEGRYYASLDPSVNIALARIRRTITTDQISSTLATMAAKTVVTKDIPPFSVKHNITDPGNLPDNTGKPLLGLVALDAGDVDVDAYVTTTGGMARLEQNNVFLLVPNTVTVKGGDGGDATIFENAETRAQKAMQDLMDMARSVIAMEKLKENPKNHGISAVKLAEQDFDQRLRERRKAFETIVNQAYNGLWYPSHNGSIVRKEIKTAGGEGGSSTIQLIRTALLDDGELLTDQHTAPGHLTSLAGLFFQHADVVSIADLRNHFACRRTWPVLDAPQLLETIIRAGVDKDVWCCYRMAGADDTAPSDIFTRDEGGIPFGTDLAAKGWSIITPQGAQKRGWLAGEQADPKEVAEWVYEAVAETEVVEFDQVVETVSSKHGQVAEQTFNDALASKVREGSFYVYQGEKDQVEKPTNLATGTAAILYTPKPGDVLITKKQAAERGWLADQNTAFELSGPDSIDKVIGALRRVDTLYGSGATTKLDMLSLSQLNLPGGGKMDLNLHEVTPQAMQALGELFGLLADLAKPDAASDCYLEIQEPDSGCAFFKELE